MTSVVVPRSPGARSAEQVLAADDTAPWQARQWIADVLASAGEDDDTVGERVVLVVSELVTNVVRHGGLRLLLRVSVTHDCIRVEVTDEGRGRVMPRNVGPTSPSGRGLAIVEAVSDGWGVQRFRGGGKTVWCEIPRVGHTSRVR